MVRSSGALPGTFRMLNRIALQIPSIQTRFNVQSTSIITNVNGVKAKADNRILKLHYKIAIGINIQELCTTHTITTKLLLVCYSSRLSARQEGIADAVKLLADKRKPRVKLKAFKGLRFGIAEEPKKFISRRIGIGVNSQLLSTVAQIFPKKGWDQLLHRLDGPTNTPFGIGPCNSKVSIHDNPQDNPLPA
jgi:hypothetical protein